MHCRSLCFLSSKAQEADYCITLDLFAIFGDCLSCYLRACQVKRINWFRTVSACLRGFCHRLMSIKNNELHQLVLKSMISFKNSMLELSRVKNMIP